MPDRTSVRKEGASAGCPYGTGILALTRLKNKHMQEKAAKYDRDVRDAVPKASRHCCDGDGGDGRRRRGGMTRWRPTGLKRLREMGNLKSADVAAAIGVPRTTYSAWETGRTELRSHQLVALARYFGTTCDDVLGYDSETGTQALGSFDPLAEDVAKALRGMGEDQRGRVEEFVSMCLTGGVDEQTTRVMRAVAKLGGPERRFVADFVDLYQDSVARGARRATRQGGPINKDDA